VEQAIRTLLTTGPVTIEGKQYTTVVHYYYPVVKIALAGHATNVDISAINLRIAGPQLILAGTLLTQAAALTVDIVHWALVDYVDCWAAAEDNKQPPVRLPCHSASA